MLLKDNMNRLLLKENLAKHYSVKNKRLHMQLFCRFIFFCLSLKKKRPLTKSVLFCAEIWSLKAFVGRIAARARFRKFFARLGTDRLLRPRGEGGGGTIFEKV